jgi:hypothetical protein|tara:strand:+ start:259 stop:495 length:237 start_codon:yes stop_codon:yes gene_type:complete
MIMDVYLHTALAMGAIGAAYFAGNYFRNPKIEDIVGAMLDTLEKEGFVETSLDKDGDKELVPISELVANAVKESKKTT